MKWSRLFVFSLSFLLLFSICVNRMAPVSAQVPPGGEITVKVDNIVSYTKVDDFLGKILSYLQTVIVTIALLFILIGAFLYITSAGDSGRVTMAKNAIFAAVIGLALGIAAPAFIKEIYNIVTPASPPTLPGGVGTSLSLLEIMGKLLNFLLSMVGIIALIALVIGGMMYLTAAGNEDRIDSGKKIVKYSIIGIFIALASLVLIRQIANFF